MLFIPSPRVLEARIGMLERAVHAAPQHMRQAILHGKDASDIQATILGVKPSVLTKTALDTLADHLNDAASTVFGPAGKTMFTHFVNSHGSHYLLEVAAMQDVALTHADVIDPKPSRRQAAMEGSRRGLPDQLSKTGFKETGVLLGYPHGSVEAYDDALKRNSYGMNPGIDHLLQKHIKETEADNRLFTQWRNTTANDWVERPVRTRVLRERVRRMMKRHLREVVKEARSDPKSQFVGLYMLNKGYRNADKILEEEVVPYHLGYLLAEKPFSYRQHLGDRQGLAWLKKVNKALKQAGFEKRLMALKERYPETDPEK